MSQGSNEIGTLKGGGKNFGKNRGLSNLTRELNDHGNFPDSWQPSGVTIGRPILEQLITDDLMAEIAKQSASTLLSKLLLVQFIAGQKRMNRECAEAITPESTTRDLVDLAVSRSSAVEALDLSLAEADLGPFAVVGVQVFTPSSRPRSARPFVMPDSRVQLKLAGTMVETVQTEAARLGTAFGVEPADSNAKAPEYLYAELGTTPVTTRPGDRGELLDVLRTALVSQQVNLGPVAPIQG